MERLAAVRAGRPGLSRRDWLRLGLAGAGALALPALRAVEAGPSPAAGRGKIYTTADLGVRDGDEAVRSIIAIDPESGEIATVLDGSGIRPRVSPDGKVVAFERAGAIHTRSVAGGDEPVRILDLEGATAGSPPAWSADGKRIVISPGKRDEADKYWVFTTVRVNADGTGREELPIPKEDGVHDWSADGAWLLTASRRNAKIGWELYVMHPDGTGTRQITEGGNPFYARFSPDGRRVLYTDGTTEERRGIWTVGIDGQDRRKVFPVEGDAIASACWSPDGQRIALAIRALRPNDPGGESARIEVMDLDGEHRTTLALPDRTYPEMPDWR